MNDVKATVDVPNTSEKNEWSLDENNKRSQISLRTCSLYLCNYLRQRC